MEVESLQDRGRQGLKPLTTICSQSPPSFLRQVLSLRGGIFGRFVRAPGNVNWCGNKLPSFGKRAAAPFSPIAYVGRMIQG